MLQNWNSLLSQNSYSLEGNAQFYHYQAGINSYFQYSFLSHILLLHRLVSFKKIVLNTFEFLMTFWCLWPSLHVILCPMKVLIYVVNFLKSYTVDVVQYVMNIIVHCKASRWWMWFTMAVFGGRSNCWSTKWNKHLFEIPSFWGESVSLMQELGSIIEIISYSFVRPKFGVNLLSQCAFQRLKKLQKRLIG